MRLSFRFVMALVIGLPLIAIFGYYLTFSGIIRHSKSKLVLSSGLAKENHQLREQLVDLEQTINRYEKEMSHLSDAKNKALSQSFLKDNSLAQESRSWLRFDFRDFFSSPSKGVDPYTLATRLNVFLDSTLLLLDQYSNLSQSLPLAFPVDTSCPVIRLFGTGFDPFVEKTADHQGVDFACPDHPDVYAAGAGTVVTAGVDAFYGLVVKISHGNGIESFYAHLDRIAVNKGSHVEKGEKIAIMGQTGQSSGVHLHFEITRHGEKLDPLQLYINEPKLGEHLVRVGD